MLIRKPNIFYGLFRLLLKNIHQKMQPVSFEFAADQAGDGVAKPVEQLGAVIGRWRIAGRRVSV